MSLITNTFFMKRIYQVAFAATVVTFLICPAHSQSVKVSTNANNLTAKDKTITVTFTEKERASALKHFGETQDLFIKEISGLSDAQLNFKDDGKRWSVAEAAEHIIVAEGLVLSLITDKVLKAPVPVGKDNYRIKDQVIWTTVTNRNTKFNAPDQIQPKGKFKTTSEIISSFKEAKAKTKILKPNLIQISFLEFIAQAS